MVLAIPMATYEPQERGGNVKRIGLFVSMLVICGAVSADFYAPETFGKVLATLRPVTWAPLNEPVRNLTRISFAVEGTRDFVVMDVKTSDYAAPVVVASDLAGRLLHSASHPPCHRCWRTSN